MNLCIVNEDHPQCNGPRKAIKACPGRGQPLLGSLWPSLSLREWPCHPFFSTGFPVNLSIAATTHGSHGPGSHQHTHGFSFSSTCQMEPRTDFLCLLTAPAYSELQLAHGHFSSLYLLLSAPTTMWKRFSCF